MSFCASSISWFRLPFGIREVASANSALIDFWDMGNLYRVIGVLRVFCLFYPHRVRETTISASKYRSIAPKTGSFML